MNSIQDGHNNRKSMSLELTKVFFYLLLVFDMRVLITSTNKCT